MPKHLSRLPRPLLEQIIDSALDAFIVIGKDSRVIAWTRQAQVLFGWSLQEAIGRHIGELIIPPALREAHERGMQHYLRTGEGPLLGRRVEIQAQDKAGRLFPVELSINEAEIDGERVFSAALRDISEAHRSRSRAERLAEVVEATPDFVGFTDLEGRALYINRAGRQMIGLRPEQGLDGVSMRDKYPAWAYEKVQEGMRHAMAEGSWCGDTAVIAANGREIPTSQVILASKDAAGHTLYLSTIIRDMTERHEVEEALRAMDRRKDAFLAMLAHELRNPLAPIATAAHILRRGPVDEQRLQRASEIIGRQAAYMARLLDDLLDVSRLTRGLIRIERAPVDLVAVARDAVEQSLPLVQARRHRLHVQSPEGEELLVTGDRTRLVQMVVNLLNNAARYTPDGGEITLTVHATATQALIGVRDTGIGIPRELLGHIFEIFTQAHPTMERSQGGLGLGLALVKNLAQLHGGSVTATSEGEGRGSEFCIRLPLRQAAPAGAMDTMP